MKIYHYFFIGIVCILFVLGCRANKYSHIKNTPEGEKLVYKVPPAPSLHTGNAEAGFEYMIYGDYIGNGIPQSLFQKFFGSEVDTVLKRTGNNANIPYQFTSFKSFYGASVVSGNCFICHSSVLDSGKVMLGIGNAFDDFQKSQYLGTKIINRLVKGKYGKDSPEWEAYEEHGAWLKAVAWASKMNNPGVNPALRIEEATLAYRESGDLSYRAEANFDIPKHAFGADVPALWTLQKKGALYYNGMGRGDFTKLLMQACLLGIHDSTAARDVQENFDDVIAWIMELEPPEYPKTVDVQLAQKGQSIFEDNCSKCHGTYGEDEYYPNKIVPLDEIGTDPYYALYAMKSGANEWYNQSWFTQTPPKAWSQPSYGYIAPPLDGVWATAPYLHNGSVPNLATLLNSKERPTYWQMAPPEASYDYKNVGRHYEEKSSKFGKKTYDTLLPGGSNQGHTFGDTLSSEERWAVIEYLKTL